MERSMVQELNGLSSSQFINNRTTFISTAFKDGDYELRKSRIQNLPSYRKEDMSSRVNFVVVFQSIEIERLSNQVQALRVALKDSQRQNFNVQNYEVQIRQLTEKCFAYQRQREEYRDQIDKLNMICQKLYEQLQTMKNRFADIDPTIKQKYRLEKERTQKLEQELQKWRARYSALQTSKNRQMDDMRLMMQSQRKSMMDRQIKQLSLKFNSERQNLQKQIRKLREGLDSKDAELQRANGKISQLQILNQELRRYEHTIDEYENKFAMISQETVRLNDLLRHKQEDIEKLNSQIGNLKRRISEYERKLRDAEQGGEKARLLQEQIRDWKTRYSKIEDQNRDYKQELSKIPEFKQVIQQISTESDRLKDAVRQKMGQIDDWRGKYQRVEAEYRDTKAQQQKQVPALQNKLNQLNNENDRLNNALKTRAGEIQNWKNKCSDFERQMSRLTVVEQDKKNLQNQLNTQTRQINELQGNIRQLQPQARRLGQVQRQLSNQRSEKQQCKKQIDRLNNAVRNASQKSDNLERKCANLERDLKTFTQIQQQLRIYKQKEINLTKEIDRINGIISEKIKEIQALKQAFQRYEKGLSQYQGIEKKLMDSVNQTQKLIQNLDQSRKENGFLQDKLIAFESEGKKLKNDIFVLSQEKEQIVRLVNSRTQQLEQAKMETTQLQSQISQLRQKEARLRQIQEKLRVTESNLTEIDRRLKSQQSRTKQLTQNLDQTSSQLTKIKRQGMMSPKFKQQFFELRSQSEQRQRQFKSLQQRILTIEGIIRKLKQAMIKQDQIAKKNDEKFGSVAKQFDASAQAMKKMFDLQNQIMRLNEENMQLEGKVRIMGVENVSLKQTYGNKGMAAGQSDFGTGVGGGLGGLGATGTFAGVGGGVGTGGNSSTGTYGSIGSISTKKTESYSSNYQGGTVPLTKGSSFTNISTATVRTTSNNNLQPSNPQLINPTSNFTNISSTSSVSNVSNLSGSNVQPFNFRAPAPQTSNYSYTNSQSQSSLSSAGNVNKADTFVNFDLFKKIQQQPGSEQNQSQSNEPPRFQFRSNNPNSRTDF